MKNIYIHIGPTKSGSTFVRKTLASNVNMLHENDYHYSPEESKKLIQLKNILPDNIEELAKEKDRLMKSLSKLPQNNIILSNSGLVGDALDGFSNVQRIAHNMSYVTANCDTRIIMYLRRQDSYIESLYTQSIHEGYSWDFQQFGDTIGLHSCDWRYPLSSYVKHFGKQNVIACTYDPTRSKDGIIEDFTAAIGLDFSKLVVIPKTSSSNVGLSRPELEMVRLCQQDLNIQQRQALRRLLQSSSAKKPFVPYNYFGPMERNELLEYYEASNREIAIEYLNRKDGILFPEDKTDRPVYDGLCIEDVSQILLRVLAVQYEKNEVALRRADFAQKALFGILDRLRLTNTLRRLLT